MPLTNIISEIGNAHKMIVDAKYEEKACDYNVHLENAIGTQDIVVNAHSALLAIIAAICCEGFEKSIRRISIYKIE